MIEEIKKELIKSPDKLKELLECYGYYHIVVRRNYIQFGRSEDSSPKSIVIRLDNNDWCRVDDYARNIHTDIFGHIGKEKCISFIEIVRKAKDILGIDSFYSVSKPYRPFGGFYDNIYQIQQQELKVYDEEILKEYVRCSNIKFLNDHISLYSQKIFEICFDIDSQAIVIPIRDEVGRLVGIKERFNYEVPSGKMKYFYSYPCSMSQVLYGFSQNYQYLTNNTVYVFEAEKSVLQAYSYDIKNCVALGSGSLSTRQGELLLSLHPQKVIFMHDVGFAFENVERNIKRLLECKRFSEMQIGYWDNNSGLYDDKVSPTDMGKDMFEYIVQNEIEIWEEQSHERI